MATADLLPARCTTKIVSQTHLQRYELWAQGCSAAVRFATVVSSSTQTDVMVESHRVNMKMKNRQHKSDQSTLYVYNKRKIQPVTMVDKMSTIKDVLQQQQLHLPKNELEAKLTEISVMKMPQNNNKLLFYTQQKTEELTNNNTNRTPEKKRNFCWFFFSLVPSTVFHHDHISERKVKAIKHHYIQNAIYVWRILSYKLSMD